MLLLPAGDDFLCRQRGGSSKINANLIFESYEIKTLLYLLCAHNCRGGCGNAALVATDNPCVTVDTLFNVMGGGGGSHIVESLLKLTRGGDTPQTIHIELWVLAWSTTTSH